MSREQYQPPSASPFGDSGMSDANPGFSLQAQEPASDGGLAIVYICGDCNSKVPLKRGDAIRCKECGHRVLYKERTKRMVQFEAR
ncbi:MAG: DNA-directed RNA polymerase core subunit rpc10 [Geoglossum umbratile]|nr:MAG: DNA-directed RNA polymerase core subunit rpc10 [Geoglossum umbratile]